MFKKILGRSTALIATVVFSAMAPSAYGWDHPGHMLTADIAFSEIQRARPDLIDKIGLLFLAHPDPAPFWVAAGEAKGKERARRMFIECARWADDVKFAPNDIPTWHSARWAIVAKDAPPEAKAMAAARQGKPAGQAIEALALNFAMVANPESSPKERALALCWVLHGVGDIHQPLHVSDLFSKDFPAGNAAGTLSYVQDPISKQPIPLHVLWDSNALRIPTLPEVDRHAQEFTKKYPRSSFPELKVHPVSAPDTFREWARESHEVAVDWAFKIQTVSDPNKDQNADRLIKNMVKFILDGVSPVKEAPEVPAEYWEKLQSTAQRRLTLAGYRIADLIISAADQIEAQRNAAAALVYQQSGAPTSKGEMKKEEAKGKEKQK